MKFDNNFIPKMSAIIPACNVEQYHNSFRYTDINVNNKIHIVLSTDNNYFRHLLTTIVSILINANSSDKFVFYILDGGISEENKYNLKSLKKIKDFEYFYITVDSEKFNSLSTGFCCDHVSRATYYRFLIPELFKHLDKVLYLDVDIIVKKSLKNLWEIDLENKYAAAILDSGKELVQECMQDLGLSQYFNAGVMLFNITKCVSENISDILFENYKKLESENKLKCLDQDVLNYTFKENIKWLSPKYNLQTDLYTDLDYSYLKYGESSVKNAIKKPVIIHYTTDRKPWLNCSDHIYKKEYFKYLKYTPYKREYFEYLYRQFKTSMQLIISIKNLGNHKILTFCGIRIKIKRRSNK